MKRKVWIIPCGVALVVCLSLLAAVVLRLNGPSPQPQASSSVEPSESADVSAGPEQEGEVEYTRISNMIAEKTTEQLIEESDLIAVCELKEISDAFQIESVGGGVMNFTDSYFETTEILRGDPPDDSGIITVRTQGGMVDNWSVIMSDKYEFQYDKKYLLFLVHAGMGGGYNTEGDYYYLNGSWQGIFPLEEATAHSVEGSGETIENGRGTDSIQLDAVRSEIEALNKIGPPDENAAYEKAMENQKANLDSGWITQEEYEEASKIYQQYATYVGDPPQYSGGE